MARKRDPDAIRVCAELSKIKLEFHVHLLQSELKRYVFFLQQSELSLYCRPTF